jgi:hypothetical protein
MYEPSFLRENHPFVVRAEKLRITVSGVTGIVLILMYFLYKKEYIFGF